MLLKGPDYFGERLNVAIGKQSVAWDCRVFEASIREYLKIGTALLQFIYIELPGRTLALTPAQSTTEPLPAPQPPWAHG